MRLHFVYGLFYGLFLASWICHTQGVNLLRNPSFEDGLLNWNCKGRPTLWKVNNASTDEISATSHVAHSGTKSLLLKGQLGGWGGRALFLHQYVSGETVWTDSAMASGIKLSWASRLTVEAAKQLSDSYSPRLLLDLRYSDGSFLSVKRDITKETSSTFISSCVTIPAYRSVDGLMVSVVVEGDSSYTALYIDDISVEFLAATDELILTECLLHTHSFPVVHISVPFYLISQQTRSQKNLFSVTVATQLTIDRLPNLNKLLSTWRGPVSAAVLIFRQGGRWNVLDELSAITELITFYQSSPLIQQYVDIHIAFEDPVNGQDGTLYPINYLRNVAIKHVKTRQVYYIDADMVPSVSAQDMANHLAVAVGELEDPDGPAECEKCAFVTPTFSSKASVESLPSKVELVEEVTRSQSSRFDAFIVVSHSVVNYNKWYKADKPYEIQYRDDIEPYFVVSTDAPLLNDMFIGYGRDKCAYSRELNEAGYKFYVLPLAYVVNVKQSVKHPSVLRRGGGGPHLRLQVFLNMYFHEREMERRYKGDGTKFSITGHQVSEGVCGKTEKEINQPESINGNAKGSSHGNNERVQKTLVSKVLPAFGLKCSDEWHVDSKLPEEPHYQGRPDYVIIEKLANEFDVQVLVQLHSHAASKILVYMALIHWKSVVLLKPNEYIEYSKTRKNMIETYSGGSINELIEATQQEHVESTLYWMSSSDSLPGYDSLVDIAIAFLKTARQHDIVAVFDLPEDLHQALYDAVCGVSTLWSLHVRGSAVIIRSASEQVSSPIFLPPVPDVVLSEQVPHCDSQSVSTDVVMFTRDRPVQTLAFLESLAAVVTGLNKVWILYRADDEIFEEGYVKAVHCVVNRNFEVDLVKEDENHSFGWQLQDILSHRSTARYIVLAVDEMVWLHPFNLTQVACLMTVAAGHISTTQLRLGHNLGGIAGNRLHEQLIVINSTSEFELYYSYRLPYDFGYVTNVDGTMISRDSFLADFGNDVTHIRNPSNLETRWIVEGLHIHARQWHLMPQVAKLVNNVLEDGRILDQVVPGEKSYSLAQMFLEDDVKVDIHGMVEKHLKQHSHTHHSFKPEFTKAECEYQ